MAVALGSVLAGASADGAAARLPHAATAASEESKPVRGVRTFQLPAGVNYVAPHWRGARAAEVRISFKQRTGRYGRRVAVPLDEVGEQRPGNETYGSLIGARRARAVRVWSDRPLRRLTLLALRDRGGPRRRWSRMADSHPPPHLP